MLAAAFGVATEPEWWKTRGASPHHRRRGMAAGLCRLPGRRTAALPPACLSAFSTNLSSSRGSGAAMCGGRSALSDGVSLFQALRNTDGDQAKTILQRQRWRWRTFRWRRQTSVLLPGSMPPTVSPSATSRFCRYPRSHHHLRSATTAHAAGHFAARRQGVAHSRTAARAPAALVWRYYASPAR